MEVTAPLENGEWKGRSSILAHGITFNSFVSYSFRIMNFFYAMINIKCLVAMTMEQYIKTEAIDDSNIFLKQWGLIVPQPGICWCATKHSSKLLGHPVNSEGNIQPAQWILEIMYDAQWKSSTQCDPGGSKNLFRKLP